VSENLLFPATASEEEKFTEIVKRVEHIFLKSDYLLSNLANLTSLLKYSFEKISWVGFYLYNGKVLYLGPFQGKIACTTILVGKGVCGTAAEKLETVIVPDVDKFPGHIACDPETRSEIVVPVKTPDGTLFGVLDLDSREYSAFSERDKNHLEKLIKYFEDNLINSRI